MSIRYITFDCYGTLIDWKRGIAENFKLQTENTNVNEEDIFSNYVNLESQEEQGYATYEKVLKETFLKLAKKLGAKTSVARAELFSKSIVNWPPFEDTVETLRYLGVRGYKRIILSNVDRNLLQETIIKNKVEVDGFVTAEEVKSYKPNKGHWNEFLRRYNVEREETIHVAGSLYHDIIPALELGFKTIWVNRYDEQKSTEVSPDYTTRQLSGIIEILSQLNGSSSST